MNTYLKEQFDKEVEKINGMSYEDKVTGTQIALDMCAASLIKMGLELKDVAFLVLSFVAAVVTVDGDFSLKEKDMLKEVFGESQVEDFVKNSKRWERRSLDKIIDSMPNEDKVHFVGLATYVAAVDGDVSKKELRYLHRLFE